MNINDIYTSQFLKAADLNGRTVRVVIENVRSEPMGDGKNKLLLTFVGKSKGMLLNRTNAANIAMAFGPETDNWIGGEIELFPQMVDFKGQMQPAIRLRIPEAKNPADAYADEAHPVQRKDRIIPNAANRTYPLRGTDWNGNSTNVPPRPALQHDERTPPPADPDDEIPF